MAANVSALPTQSRLKRTARPSVRPPGGSEVGADNLEAVALQASLAQSPARPSQAQSPAWADESPPRPAQSSDWASESPARAGQPAALEIGDASFESAQSPAKGRGGWDQPTVQQMPQPVQEMPQMQMPQMQMPQMQMPQMQMPQMQMPQMQMQQMQAQPAQQAPSRKQYSTIGEALEGSLEKELLRAGYAPREKVYVGGSDAGRPAFVKATNMLGQLVYVMVDAETFVAAANGDITLIRAKNASVIPYSTKIGVLECAGLEICGVAFECRDQLSTLVRDEDEGQPREATFTIAQKRTPAAIVDQDHVAYPIVRLSEIRADAAAALENTMAAAARIGRAAAQHCEAELVSLELAVKELSTAFESFKAMRDCNDVKIANSIAKLEAIHQDHMEDPHPTELGRTNLRLTRYNLCKRYEFSTTLLQACHKASERAGQIRKHATEINLLREYCEREFVNVGMVLDERL